MLTHPTSIYTAMAPKHFSELGWPEFLCLLHAKQLALYIENIQHLAELPFAVLDRSVDNFTMEDSVYTHPDSVSTTSDFKELLVLEKLIRLFRTESNPIIPVLSVIFYFSTPFR
jgi:hypothetical protein